MSLARAMSASASGLTAQRLRMDVIANNIANATTTRTQSGEPFRRRMVLFQPREVSYGAFIPGTVADKAGAVGRGVRVTGIVADQTPFRRVYDPGHPDADAQGYVDMPNVSIVTEMVDLISATRAYEANAAAISASKGMAARALEIGA